MKKLAVSVLICLFASAWVVAQNGSDLIVFQHADVIDGVSSEPLRDVTVIVANGKTTGIQKGLKRVPVGAEVIDLKGKWLLPGYIDTHVHIGDFESAQRALRFGIPRPVRWPLIILSTSRYGMLTDEGGRTFRRSWPAAFDERWKCVKHIWPYLIKASFARLTYKPSHVLGSGRARLHIGQFGEVYQPDVGTAKSAQSFTLSFHISQLVEDF